MKDTTYDLRSFKIFKKWSEGQHYKGQSINEKDRERQRRTPGRRKGRREKKLKN